MNSTLTTYEVTPMKEVTVTKSDGTMQDLAAILMYCVVVIAKADQVEPIDVINNMAELTTALEDDSNVQ